MARGWESKSVETQQQDSQQIKNQSTQPPTSDERARMQQRRTLQLSKARVEADLRRATTEAHRTMLKQALADLDQRLQKT